MAPLRFLHLPLEIIEHIGSFYSTRLILRAACRALLAIFPVRSVTICDLLLTSAAKQPMRDITTLRFYPRLMFPLTLQLPTVPAKGTPVDPRSRETLTKSLLNDLPRLFPSLTSLTTILPPRLEICNKLPLQHLSIALVCKSDYYNKLTLTSLTSLDLRGSVQRSNGLSSWAPGHSHVNWLSLTDLHGIFLRNRHLVDIRLWVGDTTGFKQMLAPLELSELRVLKVRACAPSQGLRDDLFGGFVMPKLHTFEFQSAFGLHFSGRC
eukprot:TRINITY_DN2961_c0_g2_i1.p1 TRINITY_DN2961_c0_g2~~TRINITY_DN2961_c0_g2_i1.p1  ORF type:complete len:265 (+),score=24.77 TRINITY_DN2961_c0_g2_i1:166-960(+)